MQKLLILKSQKNAILQSIIDKGLNPTEFQWTEKESSFTKVFISVLNYIPTDYYYAFEIHSDKHYSVYSPGKVLSVEEQYPGSWELQWQYLNTWLDYLKREIESPDLWGAIAKESELINATNSDNENTPFTKNEKEKIISGISEIRQYLIEVHKIDSELIEPRLRYLEESSQRLGRKDWINVLFSVIIGIILNATVTPESARDIL